MVHTGLMTYYSKSFPGLFKNFKTIFKESVSTGMISHFFNSNSKKAIPVSVNNVIQPKDRNPGHLKTALLILSERFILLRMRITVDKFFQQCFEEMEDPQSLEFQTRIDIDSENWMSAFKEHINCAPFNTYKGPSWRVTLLKEITESEGEGIL